MNIFEDANMIYEAGTRAIAGSKWKYQSQYFEMTQLLQTAEIQQKIMNGEYKPEIGDKFLISERGKSRFITSNNMVDKTINHILSDEVLYPTLQPYVIYDNVASQKGKGVSLFRKRIVDALTGFYREHGDNEGWIMIWDFSGYYPNIDHRKCIKMLDGFLDRSDLDPETIQTSKIILRGIFKNFEMDVSRFSDEEIAEFYKTKVDPMMNVGVDPDLLTGEKMLRKGVDIGAQPSQDIGIIYPYMIDNLVTIVYGLKYGRYGDDAWTISDDKEKLKDLMIDIKKIADAFGLIINEKKTRIVPLSKPFRLLQIQYWLTDTGKVVRKINPKSITRERKKLKAYKRQMDLGKIDYLTIENSFKSWIGSHYRIMSQEQIARMSKLYFELFGKDVKWKKKHSRLCWLMAQRSKI